MALQITQVMLHLIDLVQDHAPRQPPPDGGVLVAGEIGAGGRAQQDKDFVQFFRRGHQHPFGASGRVDIRVRANPY